MKTPLLINRLAIAVPVFCLAVTLTVVSVQVAQLRRVAGQVEQTEAEIETLAGLVRRAQNYPVVGKDPVAEGTPAEQGEFLNVLKNFAAATNVRLVRWVTVPPREPSGEDSGPAMPEGVMAVASTVEASGSYRNVRDFLYLILGAKRLLNLSGLSWKRGEDEGRTTLNFTLTRYVTVPEPSQPPAIDRNSVVAKAAP